MPVSIEQENIIFEVQWHGRERRALLKARNGMQNRLRAFVHSWYSVMRGDSGGIFQEAYIRYKMRDKGDQIVAGHDDQAAIVPAFLRTPPDQSGISKYDWQHGVMGVLDTVASCRVLMKRCLDLERDLILQEKLLAKSAKGLAVYPWVESVKGAGALGLGLIVCETGDLCNYATQYRLWKRMGLGMVDGMIQKKTTNPELAVAMGYNPERRSVMWNIALSLIRQRDYYYNWYIDRKDLEAERYPELTKKHRQRRAERYLAKMFLKDLWVAWRQCYR